MVGDWKIVPTNPGSGWGGSIKWRAHRWGVEVEATQWQMLAAPEEVPSLQTQYLRLPWRTLAQMMLSRDV